MSKMRLMKEFMEYVKENKKLWLLPVFIVLGVIAVAILVSQSNAVAPFIYSLF